MHSDEFLRSLCQHPADNVARLVYADWLEEEGDPRSEFIRMQVGMDETVPQSPEYEDQNGAAMRLWQQHHQAWEERFPSWLEPFRNEAYKNYHRGFFSNFFCTEKDFVRHAAEIADHTPLSKVRIKLTHGGRDLAKCPELSRVGELCVDARQSSITERALFHSPHLINVVDLKFCFGLKGMVTRKDCEAIGSSPSLTNLRAIEFDLRPLRTRSLDALADSIRLSSLESLDLRHSGVGVEDLEHLAASPLAPRLKDLRLTSDAATSAFQTLFLNARPNLRRFEIRFGRPQHLARGRRSEAILSTRTFSNFLQRVPHLERLILENVQLEKGWENELIRAPLTATLRELKLDNVGLSSRAAKTIADSGVFPQLNRFEFEGDISKACYKRILASPLMKQVTSFRITSRSLGTPVPEEFCGWLLASETATELRSLQLLNRTRLVRIKELMQSTKLAKLHTLEFKNVKLDEKKIAAILQTPHLSRLAQINFAGCNLTVSQKAALKERFGAALFASG